MAKETSTDNFYRAFEDRYRGSRELIKSRLRVYIPFVEPLKSACSEHKAIDLGCGRGEWLELLQELGYDARGVDLDDQMLAACRQLGLKVQTEDAIAFLKALPSESQLVVSAFHLVEHIPFPDLQTLVQETLRVLRPGGLLIMETPNPENIVVGTTNFYLDPTHQRPIPPQLLSFLPEYYGFSQVKILRLQEPEELVGGEAPSLLNVFNGVSPDYAVVAQKGGDESAIAATRKAFATEYGLTLENLAARYDDQAARRATEAETKAQQAETKAQQAETKAQQAEIKAQQAEAASNQALTQLGAVYASTSWRIAAPVRWAGTWLRKVPGLSKVRAVSKDPIAHAIRYVVRRPALKRLAVRLMRPFPGIESRLRDKRAAQLRADFMALRTATSNSYQGTGHLSGMSSQAMDSLDFLNSAAPRELSIDEILQNIRAELAETHMEK